jgi:hypothetical protein
VTAHSGNMNKQIMLKVMPDLMHEAMEVLRLEDAEHIPNDDIFFMRVNWIP